MADVDVHVEGWRIEVEETGIDKVVNPDSGFGSVSSYSDDEASLKRNLSSTSATSIDETDSILDKKKSSKKKVKVPWNVLENIEVPNDPINLTYFSKNALMHVFNLLDSKANGNGNGIIAKTGLQVICFTICLAYNLNHNAAELVGFNGDKTDLTFEEFITYLETALFTKVDPNHLDLTKVERTAWDIVSNEGRGSEVFTDNNLFTLWRIFNRLTCNSNMIDIAEVALFLKNYTKAIGKEWDSEPLDGFTRESKLCFWDFVEFLETEYVQDTSESVFLEGLASLHRTYIDEIIKTGFLNKKGHRVKSIKSRWFVFTPHLLTYYETSRMVKKKGEIIINSKTKVENIADTKNFKCRFSITCGTTGKAYEVEALDQRTKNKWMTVIKQCVTIGDDVTPLMMELSNRADKREEKIKRESIAELEHLEKEEFLRNQQKELENTRLALDRANIQTATEAALKDEERKRREELEALKIEYEKLLEEEKLARREEEIARTRQQEMLVLETSKRLELEQIKAEQEEILATERKAREGLEEISKEQAKILEEERERLKSLDEAYKAAAAEVESAHARLEASENESLAAALRVEEAKEKTRMMTGASGLNKTLALSQIRHVTHRGAGAFTDGDFSRTPIYLSNDDVPVAVNRTDISDEERIQIVETNLVKPSEFSKSVNEGNIS